MQSTLVIFSGLPGTGKSVLSDRLARELRWPVLRIDDVALKVPDGADFRYWDEQILILLTIVETQLELGISVIADSVFMNADRVHAQEIAARHKALFRPVYCFVSDEKLWEQRVTERANELQDASVSTWQRVQHQRKWFAPWKEKTALFVDSTISEEHNYPEVKRFVLDQNMVCDPLKVDKSLIKGRYHE